MSTQSNTRKWRQGIGLTALSILSGLLLALQFVLPPVAFASPERPAAPPFTPLDLAGVSVVRLVVEYTGTTTHLTARCTGLGTLVASWSPTTPTEQNNWVLTDGTLVNVNGQTCVSTTKGSLTNIKLYANTLYTNSMLNLALIGQLDCQQQTGQKTSCKDTTPETLFFSNGALLFSFHTDATRLQPFLNVAAQATGTPLSIELANSTTSTGTWPSKATLSATDNPLIYLSPKLFNKAGSNTSATATRSAGSATAATTGEPGMPLVDSNGNLVGMSVSNGALLSGQIIMGMLNQQSVAPAQHTNSLNSNWNRGITQYEAGNYVSAEATLKQIASANTQFQAPLIYEGKAAAQISGTRTGGTTQGAVQTPGLPGILIIVGIVAGLLLLVLLLVLVSMWARRRQELARFEAERTAAQRDAELDMQQRQQQALPLQHVILEEQKAPITNWQSPPEKLCPNCGRTVRADATYCPNCRYQLSPAAPGARPTIRISPASELPISEKAPVSAITSQSQQALVKETVLDDQAIRATLQRLWDRAAQKE